MTSLDAFNPRDVPAYTVGEASHYLGVPKSTLRSWFAGQRGFRAVIRPADAKSLGLSFTNLVEAYVLTAIRRKHRIGLPTIRRGLDFLVRRLGAKRPLIEQQFATNGVDLFVDHLGQVINISRDGQIEMADLIRAYLERIERDGKGLPVKLYPFMRNQAPRSQPRTVVIDPRVSFGRPVLAGTGIPTAVLAEQFKAGDPVPVLAREYGADEEAVWDAIRCELDLEAA
ncbi:MAG TPA: DUF433 domain-containing protein [Burkholderiales bacterium]|nr:DUF433 domain-containing protein [Burkholderiales bacterium]